MADGSVKEMIKGSKKDGETCMNENVWNDEDASSWKSPKELWLFAWYVVTFIENCFRFLFINNLLWHEIQHLTFPACVPKEKFHNMDLCL